MSLSVNEGAALVLAICFAAGLNVYATVATLGLLARAGFLELPGSLDVVTNWWVIGAGGVMFVVEFFADKIPVFDLLWNAAQTVIRVPAGAILAYAASTELGLGWQIFAATAGGTISFVAHGWKTAARAAANTSPEPASNLILEPHRRRGRDLHHVVRDTASLPGGRDRARPDRVDRAVDPLDGQSAEALLAVAQASGDSLKDLTTKALRG